MLTVGSTFFLSTACQHKTNKIENTFYHLPSSSYAFYKIKAILKALNQLNLIHIENYSKQQVSYFYQIVHLMMNRTKFGSLELDNLSSSYEFPKFDFKTGKE